MNKICAHSIIQSTLNEDIVSKLAGELAAVMQFEELSHCVTVPFDKGMLTIFVIIYLLHVVTKLILELSPVARRAMH